MSDASRFSITRTRDWVIKWIRCHRPIIRQNRHHSCRVQKYGKTPVVTRSSAAITGTVRTGSQTICNLIRREVAWRRSGTLMAPLSMIRKVHYTSIRIMTVMDSRHLFHSHCKERRLIDPRLGRNHTPPEANSSNQQVANTTNIGQIKISSIIIIIRRIWTLKHSKLGWASVEILQTFQRRYQLISIKRAEQIKHLTAEWNQKGIEMNHKIRPDGTQNQSKLAWK